MTYHPVTEEIEKLLADHSCWFETFEHEAVRTSEEATKLRTGYTLHQGAKTIIVRVKLSAGVKRSVMLVVPTDKRFDSMKVKNLLMAKDIRFATEQEISSITNGVQIGGIPPFGNLFNMEVIADITLFELEKIIFNAGDRRFSIAMKSVDFQKLVHPQIASIITAT